MNYQEALGHAAALAMTRGDTHEVGIDDVALVIRFKSAGERPLLNLDHVSDFFAVTNRERKRTGSGRLAPHTVWAVARLVSFVGAGGDSRAMLEVTQEGTGRELPQ